MTVRASNPQSALKSFSDISAMVGPAKMLGAAAANFDLSAFLSAQLLASNHRSTAIQHLINEENRCHSGFTFRRTKEDCLHVVAHPDSSRQRAHMMAADHTDPTVFTTALGLAGVSTESESTLSFAAQEAWRNRGLEVCCEAIDLMPGQVETLSFRPTE